MLHFLSLDARSRILAVVALHTGRATVVEFFEVALEGGLVIDEIYEENADGVRRPWLKENVESSEDANERKKWLIVAILRHQP